MTKSYIGKLYALAQYAKSKNLIPDELYQLRQEKALPILAKFKAWLDSVFQLIDYN